MQMHSYYSIPDVRDRMIEFLGGATLETATAMYVTSDDGTSDSQYLPQPISDFGELLNQGLGLGRSLWDRKSLVVDLEIEHVNFDTPSLTYLEPKRAFGLQTPVVLAIEEILLDYGIAPLHILTGRGHHFVWRIERGQPAFRALADLGRVGAPLQARYATACDWSTEHVDYELGRAYAGLVLVLEFVAHQVIENARSETVLPIEITAVETGHLKRDREIVCIDLSEYGDPLHTRGIRIPFSIYRKARQYRFAIGDCIDNELPPLVMVPLHEMDLQQGLLTMRDLHESADLARRASTQIPEQSLGMERLVAAYSTSPIAPFHNDFYEQEHDSPDRWPRTYDRLTLDSLPPSAQRILRYPNELLLKPSGIRHLVRVLLAQGWHPRHIAGLIRSKYERDFGWGEMWYYYDAASRADFYVRTFAGLVAMGLDDLEDFTSQAVRRTPFGVADEIDPSLKNLANRLLARYGQKS